MHIHILFSCLFHNYRDSPCAVRQDRVSLRSTLTPQLQRLWLDLPKHWKPVFKGDNLNQVQVSQGFRRGSRMTEMNDLGHYSNTHLFWKSATLERAEWNYLSLSVAISQHWWNCSEGTIRTLSYMYSAEMTWLQDSEIHVKVECFSVIQQESSQLYHMKQA